MILCQFLLPFVTIFVTKTRETLSPGYLLTQNPEKIISLYGTQTAEDNITLLPIDLIRLPVCFVTIGWRFPPKNETNSTQGARF